MKVFNFVTAAALAVSLAACSSVDGTGAGTAGGAGIGAGGAGGVNTSVDQGSIAYFTTTVGDRVFFATDSSSLDSSAQATLALQADWLATYPDRTLVIQGHADERGTREYNLALGARRAQAAFDFLVAQGVNPSRMSTVSFGKERPEELCSDASCWAANRRAVTVVAGGLTG
ncbi:peptidoglycan-associated lipoprotein Pal [Pontivivens insulae]|uniref:Peptidoglycan-associated lipoprotein n=1 Tax=Pontivivens insulae TaxID=1639689 RepID=A0A2R8A8V9_9RHOB|nr:peptidoglycan-associated lipoprotein Pal [Pontivivens insulae]RED18687.1 peptidoglycan-associated lipoprotein [Pontivivens insulae]SPF28585.1 Outer membrane lipoprotein Omp16 [Pontivivens insulae]